MPIPTQKNSPDATPGYGVQLAKPRLAFVNRSASRRAFHKIDAVDGIGLVEIALAGVGYFLVVRRVQGPPPITSGIFIEGEIHASHLRV